MQQQTCTLLNPPLIVCFLSLCLPLLFTHFLFTSFVCLFNKTTFLLFSHFLLLLLFCCQSEADEDSEMRTQVHWARFVALLSASHPQHKMHWAAQHPPSVTLCHLSTLAYLLLLLTCLLSHHTQTDNSQPDFTSQTAKLSLLLNMSLKLISQVLLFVNGEVMLICLFLLMYPRVWFQSFTMTLCWHDLCDQVIDSY